MACAVPGCRSNSSRHQNYDLFISFHRFPNDTLMKGKWLEAIDRKDWDPHKRRICSKHFTAESFVNQDDLKWRRLKPESIPTLLLPKGQETLVLLKTEPDEDLSTSSTIKIKWDQVDMPLPEKTHVTQNASINGQSVETHRLIIEHERLKKRYSRLLEISKRRFLKIRALREKNRRLRMKLIM